MYLLKKHLLSLTCLLALAILPLSTSLNASSIGNDGSLLIAKKHSGGHHGGGHHGKHHGGHHGNYHHGGHHGGWNSGWSGYGLGFYPYSQRTYYYNATPNYNTYDYYTYPYYIDPYDSTYYYFYK